MKYVYSVVRFVPDPVRGEFINVGLIVGSDESSEWQLRTIENPRRARAIDVKGLVPLVWTFIDSIGRRLDEYTEAVEASKKPGDVVSEQWLQRMHDQSLNVIQLSQPAPIVADSIADAMSTLFEQFVIDPEARRFPFQKKQTALAAVRRAYSEHGIIRGADFEEAALVRGAAHREHFDFTVMNGRVVQLVQAWSFQVPGQEDLLEKVKAWAWTVGDIRRHGGEAETRDRKAIVPKDVDVSAVYVPPATGSKSRALDEALSAFGEINVSAIPTNDVEGVATRAQRLLKKS